MGLRDLLRGHPAKTDPPSFIRAIEERDHVRIVRLQGDVGKAVGTEVKGGGEPLE